MKGYFDRLTILVIAYGLGFLSGQRHPEPQKVQEPETFTARVSAYCACEQCCPGTSDNITANGHRIKPGEKFCAADKRYAFGTMFRIPGYGTVPCWDRGGAIKGDKIDVYFDSHSEALIWGVQNLKVEIERR